MTTLSTTELWTPDTPGLLDGFGVGTAEHGELPIVGTGELAARQNVPAHPGQAALLEQLLAEVGGRPESFVDPAYLWVPTSTVYSDGLDAIGFAADLGIALDPEQKLALYVLGTEDETGHFAALSAAVIGQRRNLKTHVLEVLVLHRLFVRGVRNIIWTSHQMKATNETVGRILALIKKHSWLASQVEKVINGKGEQEIRLYGGQRLMFLARSSGTGRSLESDLLILDEALFVDPAMTAAVVPTMATRENPQIVYGSSAGIRRSEVLRAIRDRGRPGGDEQLAYIEWCAPRVDCASPTCDHALRRRGCALERRDLILRANHAVAKGRISWRYLAGERSEMAPRPHKFATERLGWWEDPPPEDELEVEPPAYDVAKWKELALDPEKAGDKPTVVLRDLAIALDVPPAGNAADIALSGLRPDGRKQVEHIDSRDGTAWVVQEVVQLCERLRVRHGIEGQVPVVVDPGSQAGKLVEPLRKAGVQLTLLNVRQVAAAAGALEDDIKAGALAHTAPDEADINAAVQDARWRPLAGARALTPGPARAPIGGLVAVSFAAWAVVALRSMAAGGVPEAVGGDNPIVGAPDGQPAARGISTDPFGAAFDALNARW